MPHSSANTLQTCAGRPIPVLPQHTFPGNVILSSRATSGLSPLVNSDPELERLSIIHITTAAKNAFAALAQSHNAASTSDPNVEASEGSFGLPHFHALSKYSVCRVDLGSCSLSMHLHRSRTNSIFIVTSAHEIRMIAATLDSECC